jgi:hypothetical protein
MPQEGAYKVTTEHYVFATSHLDAARKVKATICGGDTPTALGGFNVVKVEDQRAFTNAEVNL